MTGKGMVGTAPMDTPDRASAADERAGAARDPVQRIVLVTGPSGAGRSTAIHALEDLGYEAIDNLPFSLIPRLLDGPPLGRPVALGIDVRNRDFSVSALIDLIDGLTRHPDAAPEVLYLDCSSDELLRRYAETRRRHPLADNDPPAEAIAREIDLLTPIRARAEIVIDTTHSSPHDLRREIGNWFAQGGQTRLSVSIHSFSYKRGVPRGLDMMFDCRFLRNPHWKEDLRPLDGRDAAVGAYVAQDQRFGEFFDRVRDLLLLLLPAQVAEGKSHFAVGFGCTGGQHRSVYVAERMAEALAEAGWQVSKRHRELERRAGGARAHVQGGRA